MNASIKDKKLAVVIPFYKNKEQLDRCLAALVGQVEKENIFVIDDSDTQTGFTAAVNRGLKMAFPYTYALVLNQDCYLYPQAIDTAIKFMDDHPRCALAGITQVASYDHDYIIHGGTRNCFPLGEHGVGSLSKNECGPSRQVPWVNGACMFVRVDAMFEFGLMDENYKMFYSDSDWSFTARSRGWECWYIAPAICIHEQGVTKEGITEDSPLAPVFTADQNHFYIKWLTDGLYKKITGEFF